MMAPEISVLLVIPEFAVSGPLQGQQKQSGPYA